MQPRAVATTRLLAHRRRLEGSQGRPVAPLSASATTGEAAVVTSKGQWQVKPRDVKKAVQAVRASGLDVARVEFDKDGKFTVVAGKPTTTEKGNSNANEWDGVLNGKPKTEVR